MAEQNPHRRIGRTIAFSCYILAGLVLLSGVFFTLAAATIDISQLPLKDITNQRLAIMNASIFMIITLMIVLFGWRVQSLYGQRHREQKLVAKSAVGCLRLGSLGCGLWALPSTLTALATGTLLVNGAPTGVVDMFVGLSGFILAIILMLSVAWFISANFTSLKPEECRRAYQEYLELVEPSLPRLADPETRAYVQEQTLVVLTKLDTTLKSTLMEYLNRSGLLTGETRILLRNADFRHVDLRSLSLPRADLREVNLEDAKLQGAILFEANLYKAKLKKADLRRANLQGANLQQADLTGAMLEGTNLRGANTHGMTVTPGQLKQARMDLPSDAS
ncbi:MAG: pentapeptide repeat-containing protein [Acidobacteria bacterium]|nr:pentapeptide repeat-containing protein [Acidobacteriota bacterium]